MMTATRSVPEQGQLVSVRSRQWTVQQVRASTLPPPTLQPSFNGPQHLVTLASVEDDGLGEELQVVWEIEPGARVVENIALPTAEDFDLPETLDAFLDAVRWGAASSADVKTVQAPFRSGIDIEDYQLDPVVRAVQMPRVNLLIADDVGLGKTIEAGMTALELIIRHRARRVLIVCPSSLQIQWREQMRDKFGLDFRVVDSDLMKQLRRSRGIHVNPWSHYPRLITSIDFLKRERPLRLFRETLPGPDEPAYPRRYDLLICDEAHNCAPSGRGKYATDSMRTQALRELVPHFEHKLFLSATPHNGYPESFSALLELLDNQRFSRGTAPDRKQLDAVMVRRLKSELPPRWDGSPRFPKRVLTPLEVAYTVEERAVHAALRRYSELRQKDIEDAAERFASEFVLKTLKKRLFSSPAAFGDTLARHRESLRTARRARTPDRPRLSVLQREIDRMDEEYARDEEYEEATDDALDAASRLFREPTGEETVLLEEMETWAFRARSQRDSKAETLISWLNENLCPGNKWSNERVIIFTEYRATQNWLRDVLAAEGFTGQGRLMTMYGGMETDKREAVKAAFQASPAVSPVRILLATDAASEGLDLQNFCSQLIHYEIPWSPTKMEQRNGRVDRHGQKAKEVNVYHFVGQGYRQRASGFSDVDDLEADLEFLMRVALKVETIREDLGKVGPILAEQVEAAMLGRRPTLITDDDARQKADPVRKMLKFERDLARRIDELMDQYRETQRELRLSPDNVRKVIEVALDLAGQPPLEPVDLGEGRKGFRLPALKGSWSACAEGLTHPHTQEVRPVVFDHAAAQGRDDVVLVHLNHRLAQMSLRLLRAEVWSDQARRKLQRVTARTVPDHVLATPAVVAHARLVVIGGDSHRLHEEVITAGGYIDKGRFQRMRTLKELDESLAAVTSRLPSELVRQTLLGLYPVLAPALTQALDARMRDRIDGLQRKLGERAAKEADDIRVILTELQQAIAGELDEPAYQQSFLPGMEPEEVEQFRRNQEAMRARLKEIPAEIERETAAIQGRYANPQARLFPVAVTFLVPEKLAKG
jgi:SNF2 family DNA or RNA helicase